VLAVVPYLQVAFSFVDIERVVDVVPEESVPTGEPADSVGGAVSVGVLYSSLSVAELQPGSFG